MNSYCTEDHREGTELHKGDFFTGIGCSQSSVSSSQSSTNYILNLALNEKIKNE
jgi:hypothetical protein